MMIRHLSPVMTGDDTVLARCRRLMLHVPLSAWMLILVTVAVAGYAIVGFKYYAVEQQHQELLKNNSTYIELDQLMRAASADYWIALSLAQSGAELPQETVRSAAMAFVNSARAASSSNTVAALNERFAAVRSAAAEVETAVAGATIDGDALRTTLEAVGERLSLLALIATDGRRAEWENLTTGIQSSFQTLIALICAGALLVGGLGYFLASIIRRVFADVIRINAAIGEGMLEIDIPRLDSRTEAAQMYAALRTFRENSAEKARLEAAANADEAARAARQRRIEAGIDRFRRRIQELLAAVAGNMDQMQATAKQLAGTAKETSGRAGGAAAASEQASSNVQTVAAAAEELASSISEINRRVCESTDVVMRATGNARKTNDSVAGLSDAVQKIGEVVTLIRAIAEQTNLLALNATIEAARAGDMGKGFAVVASEVKVLAGQTAKATEEIAEQIGAIQSSTRQSVEAIKLLAASMEDVNAFTSVIAASVEKQGEATAEISRNVQQAASETQKAAVNMTGVTTAVGETMQAVAMVERASTDVVERTADLRQAVNLFLEDVSAA
jgi:methyl-accepting chemotaxis protein